MTDRPTAQHRRVAASLLLSACMAGLPITAFAGTVSRAAADDACFATTDQDAAGAERLLARAIEARGSTVRVAFDRASGRIIATRSRDREPDLTLGEVERLDLGATETSGVILPDRIVTRVSGTVVALQSGEPAIVIDESPGNSTESRLRQP